MILYDIYYIIYDYIIYNYMIYIIYIICIYDIYMIYIVYAVLEQRINTSRGCRPFPAVAVITYSYTG